MTLSVSNPMEGIAVDMDTLLSLYRVPDVEEIRRYLETNPFLIPLVLAAPREIRALFGPETQIRLEISCNLEARQSKELFALIQTELPEEEAQHRLRLFDMSWWRTIVRQTQGLFSTDVENINVV